jgi:hypothetical protein
LPIIAGLSISLPETAESHADTHRSAAEKARTDAIAMRRDENLGDSATNERGDGGSGEAVQCNSCGRLFVPSGGRRNF